LHHEAVESFNLAIQSGYSNIDVFRRRGCSLQSLHRHELAINDFNKIISHRPEDCNSFFLRSVSKNKIDDFRGAILDIKKAIKLSLADNDTNEAYHDLAFKLGFGTITSLYEAYLNNYRRNMD
jgi:tetratricopeptide (TPR) repeat protein